MKIFLGAFIGAAFVAAAARALTTEAVPAPDDAARSLAASLDAFAVALYQEVRVAPGNVVLSPLSAAAVLTLARVGAGGDTAAQLDAALRLEGGAQRAAEGFRQLLAALQANDDDVLLRMANKMYLQMGFDLLESFQQTAVDEFRSGVEELDFQGDAENAVDTINQWVEEYTEGKIVDLLSPDMVGPATVLILVNAIYFRAAWSNVFSEFSTRTGAPFYVTESQQVEVAMMSGTFRLEYADLPELNAAAVKLPFKGSSIQSEMIIVLPNDVNGLEAVESNLGQLNLANVPFSQPEVAVYLPRFTIESTIPLNEILQKMGIVDLFSPQANLSGIADADLYVSQVIQKAYIKVNENGTEAAAATAIVIRPLVLSLNPRLPIEFKADHPFLFLLRTEDVCLFMGRVVEPSE